MDLSKLSVGLLAVTTAVIACSDGEAGSGRPPLDLETYCVGTCEAKAALGCEKDPSQELCEARCLSQPLPAEDSPCYEEEIAIVHCQYENRDAAFECDFAGKSADAVDVCDEERREAVINCGGL